MPKNFLAMRPQQPPFDGEGFAAASGGGEVDTMTNINNNGMESIFPTQPPNHNKRGIDQINNEPYYGGGGGGGVDGVGVGSSSDAPPTYRICTHRGCTTIVKNLKGLCAKHNEVAKKRKVKRCSFEGCTNQVQKYGVCVR